MPVGDDANMALRPPKRLEWQVQFELLPHCLLFTKARLGKVFSTSKRSSDLNLVHLSIVPPEWHNLYKAQETVIWLLFFLFFRFT